MLLKNSSKTLFCLICFAGLASCGPRHNIIGSDGWGFSQRSEVLLDVIIDDLRIRHVRLFDNVGCSNGYSEHLEIVGTIGPDSTEAIGRILPKLHKCINNEGIRIVNSIYMSSGGGLLSDGFKLGRLFRSHSTSTHITGGQYCASSCAIAFLGGDFRFMNGNARLMFHAPYITNIYGLDCSDRGQVKDLKNYYIEMLGQEAGNYLLSRTMDHCSVSEGWTLNAHVAELFGLLRH